MDIFLSNLFNPSTYLNFIITVPNHLKEHENIRKGILLVLPKRQIQNERFTGVMKNSLKITLTLIHVLLKTLS